MIDGTGKLDPVDWIMKNMTDKIVSVNEIDGEIVTSGTVTITEELMKALRACSTPTFGGRV